MRIIGTHDETMMLKLQCTQHAKCKYCALQPFCEKAFKKTQGNENNDYYLEINDTYGTYTINLDYGDNITTKIGKIGTWYQDGYNGTIYTDYKQELKIDESLKLSCLSLFQIEKFSTILIQSEKRQKEET